MDPAHGSIQRSPRREARGLLWVLVLAALVGLGGVILPPLFRTPPAIVEDRERIGDLDSEVRAIFERLLQRARNEPWSDEAHGMLGFAYEANTLTEAAARCFAIAAELDPSDPVWEYHGILQSEDAFDVRVARLEKLVERFPGFAAGLHCLGEDYLTQGEVGRAEECFRACAALVPEAPEVQVSMAAARNQRKEYAEAVRILEPIVEVHPDYKRARFQLGNAYRGLGRLEDAQRELARGKNPQVVLVPEPGERYVEQYRRSFESVVDRAVRRVEAAQRMPDRREAALQLAQAVRDLERALEMRPGDSSARNNLGVALKDLYRRSGDKEHLDRAIETLESVLAEENLLGARINLSDCYRLGGQYPQAVQQAREAVALAPDEALAHAALAEGLRYVDEIEEALEEAALAARLDSSNPAHRVLKAEFHMILRQNIEARRELERVVAEVPDDVRARVNLANTCIRMGEIDAAKEHLAVAQRIAPDHPHVARLRARLAALDQERPGS